MAALRDKVFEEEYAYIAVGGQENSFLKINLYYATLFTAKRWI
jgi:hypothetical protein